MTGNEIAAFGVRSTGFPYLDFVRADSKVRLTLRLEGADGNPLLGMGDSTWEGKVILGFIPPDVPSRSWDNWGLVFRARSGQIASLAMVPSAASGKLSGKLALLDDNGEVWVAPK